MKIVSRKEAITNGLTKYFTGKPCVNGHIEERYKNGGCCVECSKLCSRFGPGTETAEQRRKYHLNYISSTKNKEKLKSYKNTYRKQNREIVNAQKRRQYARTHGNLPL